jgi:hypothetical protein
MIVAEEFLLLALPQLGEHQLRPVLGSTSATGGALHGLAMLLQPDPNGSSRSGRALG